MKCSCEKYPVNLSYGFLEGDILGDDERKLFIDGGKIGGMAHCSNCGKLKMFISDKEVNKRAYERGK